MNNYFGHRCHTQQLYQLLFQLHIQVFAFWALSILMQISLGEVDLFYINDPHDILTWRGGTDPSSFLSIIFRKPHKNHK